ncbi:hypothetical protein AB9E35_34145, partial [Rhizobium leguminosarum]
VLNLPPITSFDLQGSTVITIWPSNHLRNLPAMGVSIASGNDDRWLESDSALSVRPVTGCRFSGPF